MSLSDDSLTEALFHPLHAALAFRSHSLENKGSYMQITQSQTTLSDGRTYSCDDNLQSKHKDKTPKGTCICQHDLHIHPCVPADPKKFFILDFNFWRSKICPSLFRLFCFYESSIIILWLLNVVKNEKNIILIYGFP